MTYTQFASSFKAEIVLPTEEEILECINAESILQNSFVIESVMNDFEYSAVIEGAIDSVKKVIEKIKEALHKLIVKIGLIIRSIQHNIQAKKLKEEYLYLNRVTLNVSKADFNALKKLFKELDIEGFDEESSYDDRETGYYIPFPYIKKYVNNTTKKAVEIDNELEFWLNHPEDSSINPSELRKKASKATNLINLLINYLNGFVCDVKMKKMSADYAEKKEKKNGKNAGKGDN